MALLTPQEIAQLSPIIEPFERSDKAAERREIKVGEGEKGDFVDFIHNGVNNSEPKDLVRVTLLEVLTYLKIDGKHPEKSYLWVIDDQSIKIIREKISNYRRTHKPDFVCHTNLTGSGKAFVGGEMFFGYDGTIYINTYSDRYGRPSELQWSAAKDYIVKTGYRKLVDIEDIKVTKWKAWTLKKIRTAGVFLRLL